MTHSPALGFLWVLVNLWVFTGYNETCLRGHTVRTNPLQPTGSAASCVQISTLWV